jgi:hypothetical protein
MNKRGVLFHCGFALSTLLLLIVAATGVHIMPFFERARSINFQYVSTPGAFRWAETSYIVLNLPAVVASIAVISVIARLFAMSIDVAMAMSLPLSLYFSLYWWSWLDARLTMRREHKRDNRYADQREPDRGTRPDA